MIPHRAVLQNVFWFLLMCAAFRLLCWVTTFPAFPNRDLCAIVWGYIGGSVSLRYLVNRQAETAALKAAAVRDFYERCSDRPRRGFGL